MSSAAFDDAHPVQRWIDATFGDHVPSLPGSLRTVLEEQIFVVLLVAVRPTMVPTGVLDRLARAAAVLVTTSTDPGRQRHQLSDLLTSLPLSTDRLIHAVNVMVRLAQQPPHDTAGH